MFFCNHGGYLVGASYWLPLDPYDYFRASYGIASIGCNQLVCARCGQAVRSVLEGHGRRYTCGCESYLAHGGVYLDADSYDADPDPVPAWRCAGHRGFRPPGVVAGITLDASPDWPAVVATHITASNSLHSTLDRIPGFTLTRIYQASESVDDQRELGHAVGTFGNHPSPRVRQALALFFALNDKAPGLVLAANAWRTDPALYDDHPAACGPDPGLKGNMLEALSGRIIGHTPEAAAALSIWRWAALRGSGLGAFLHTAKQFDAAWLNQHLEALFDLAPADWYPIIRAVRVEFSMRLAPGCRRALAEGHATREQIAGALTEQYGARAEAVIAAL